jgi:hypothetical protein
MVRDFDRALNPSASNQRRIEAADEFGQRQRNQSFIPVSFRGEDVGRGLTQLTEGDGHEAARKLSQDFLERNCNSPVTDLGKADFGLNFERQRGENCLQGDMDAFAVLRGGLSELREWVRFGRPGSDRVAGGSDGQRRRRRGIRGRFLDFGRGFSDEVANEGFKEAKHLYLSQVGWGRLWCCGELVAGATGAAPCSQSPAGKRPAFTAAPRDDSASLLIYAQFICLMSLHCFRAA